MVMMNCESLVDLAGHFQSRVALVKGSLQLGRAGQDPTTRSLLSGVAGQLRQLDVLLVLMKAELAKRREKLQQFEVIRNDVNELNNRVTYAAGHLPEKLPRKTPPIPHSTCIDEVIEKQTDVVQSQQNLTCPPPTKKSSKQVPHVEYLTVKEFESAPKYMRGRITYEQINSAIDSINQAVQAKYKIVYTPKSAQTEQIKKKIVAYRSQHTKDTKNCHFFVEEDVRRHSSLKLDSVARSMLNILRTCGRLKEVRGGNLTRYVLVTDAR